MILNVVHRVTQRCGLAHMRYLKTHKRGPFATAASQMGVTNLSHTEFTIKGPTQIGHLVHLPTRGPSWQFTIAWQLKIKTLTGKNRGSTGEFPLPA